MDEKEEEEVGEDDMVSFHHLYCALKKNTLLIYLELLYFYRSHQFQKTFKFPYLKNPHFDSHFDLKDPAHLAGKSLLWLARDSHSLSESLRDSVKLLGALLYNRLDIAETLACSSIHGSVAEIVRAQLTPPEGVDPDGQHLRIMDKLANCQTAEKPISDVILSHLNKIRESEELSLASKQIEEFAYWNKRRHELIKAQADRVLLKIRAEEITKELAELEHQSEKLFFFENRLKWEKKAAENEEINVEMSNK
uniref:OBERON-like protein n=1 Tax=Heterorhabditis bacteriophora TaxID=37862 RepID=A0A1I7WTI6_HETBA